MDTSAFLGTNVNSPEPDRCSRRTVYRPNRDSSPCPGGAPTCADSTAPRCSRCSRSRRRARGYLSQQILWLRFLGHRFDLPCWNNALQRVDQRINYVRRVDARRGKDNMEGPMSDEIRDVSDGISSLVHELPSRLLAIGFRHRVVASNISVCLLNRPFTKQFACHGSRFWRVVR
jgi:hypothetical protein